MLRSVHLSVITPPRPDMGAECCDERVCVCVSVCLSAIISSKPRPIFTKFLVHVTYGRGSVLLWWRNDMLCTSGLWMTSYLLISQGC